jgi:plastocyanin
VAGVSTPPLPAPPQVFVAVAVALSLVLAACGPSADQASSTATTPGSPATAPDGASATVDTTTTTTRIATTTAETKTTTTEAKVVEIVVEGGEVVIGPERIQAELGSRVSFVVVSDAVDHVHIHGYDIYFDLTPGGRREIQFTADVPGMFEVEMEESHLLLVELEVS